MNPGSTARRWLEAPDQEAGGDEQNDRERDLAHDQRAPEEEMARARRGEAPAAPNLLADRAGEPDGGPHAEPERPPVTAASSAVKPSAAG